LNELSTLFVQAIHGLVYGMLLFLVSSGLTVVFGMMRILNMAHAGIYMLGAYFGYTIINGFGDFWISLLLAPILAGAAGVIVHRVFLQKAQSLSHGHELVVTFGIFVMIVELIKWFWGANPLPVAVPAILKGSIHIMSITYPFYRLFILFVGVLTLGVMAAVLLRTRIGVRVRASVADGEMLEALGTNVRLLQIAIFGFGSALAGLAGVTAAPFLSPHPGMGLEIMTDTFVVIVIGGMGSLLGAFMASVLIGEIQSFGILLLPDLALVFQFLVMAVVLIVKPTGLRGLKA
jgi:branched-chain amino acid transport system permease protein